MEKCGQFVKFYFYIQVAQGSWHTLTCSQHYPNMKITVCDLQSVVDSAHHFRPSLEECPNQANVSYMVGDMFQADLPKAELYVLSRILHD